MLNLKSLLEKAKWGKLSDEEIKIVGETLNSDNDYDVYTLIHIIGKAGLTQFEKDLKNYLNYPEDPLVSMITLRTLCTYWGQSQKYIDNIVSFLIGAEWDEDEDLRLEALNIIGNYLKENKSNEILQLVLGIFENERNSKFIRSAAYDALGKTVGKTWKELPPAHKPMNFDQDVDSVIIDEIKQILKNS